MATNATLSSAHFDMKRLVKTGLDAAIYRRGAHFIVAVGPFESRSAAAQALPKAGAVLGAGAVLRSLTTWCPGAAADDEGVWSCP